MNNPAGISKEYKWYVLIGLCGFLVHGLLLFNDGIYWDGWMLYSYVKESNWGALYSMFIEVGKPMTIFVYYMLAQLPSDVFVYKLIGFTSILLSGFLVYMICCQLRFLRRKDSLFIALLSLSYPAFQVSIYRGTAVSLFYYCLFFLACFVAVNAEKRSGLAHFLSRVCALVMFLVSFTINSLLIFYFGFLVILGFYAKEFNSLSLKQVFTRFLPRRLDYALLPFLCWFATRSFFPPHGVYSAYNEIDLSLAKMVGIYEKFFWNSIYYQFKKAFSNLLNYPVLGLIALAIVAVLLVYHSSSRASACHVERKVNPFVLLCFGLFLLLLGIFPYAAVGKGPWFDGWTTRHSLLIGLPMSIILIGFTRIVASAFHILLGRLSPWPENLRAGLVAGFETSMRVVLIAVFTLSTINYYVVWQARWVKDRSIIIKLSEKADKLRQFSTFWVNDRFNIGSRRIYDFYEWSSIFKVVTGDESRVGLDDRLRYFKDFLTGSRWKRYFSKRYMLSEFDPSGPQAVLKIRRGPKAGSDSQMAMTYLYYKFFFKNRLLNFLKGITEVQIGPV